MTKIFRIDYGRVKIGLAISEGTLAEPWKVVTTGELKKVLEREKFDRIVVGVSEGEMGEESKIFAKSIGAETFDETLTTHDAQELSKQAGHSQKKRRKLEDAFAATVMLQSYLDHV